MDRNPKWNKTKKNKQEKNNYINNCYINFNRLLYQTLATSSTTSEENDIYVIDVDGNTSIELLARTSKKVYYKVKNTNKGVVKYGVGYSGTDVEAKVYEITNNYRSLVGVSSLTLDSSLVEAASIRAKELSDSFSHTRPNGSSCFTVLSELGISYGTAGENIAAGYSSSQSVMEGWRSSSGHYQNIISSKFKKIGIGVNIVNNQYYWVQIFSN